MLSVGLYNESSHTNVPISPALRMPDMSASPLGGNENLIWTEIIEAALLISGFSGFGFPF